MKIFLGVIIGFFVIAVALSMIITTTYPLFHHPEVVVTRPAPMVPFIWAGVCAVLGFIFIKNPAVIIVSMLVSGVLAYALLWGPVFV